jgi:hypothetical protein
MRDRRLYLLFITTFSCFVIGQKMKSDFNFRRGRIIQDTRDDKGLFSFSAFDEGGEQGNREFVMARD